MTSTPRSTPQATVLRLSIPAMDCPVEVNLIRQALDGNPCITEMQFDTHERVARFGFTGSLADRDAILKQLANMGMPATVMAPERIAPITLAIDAMRTREDVDAVLATIGLDAQVDAKARHVTVHVETSKAFALVERLEKSGYPARLVESAKMPSAASRIPVKRLATAFVFALVAEGLELAHATPEWVVMVCSAVAIALAGFTTIKRGLVALSHLNFTMTTLMAVAVIGAVILGAWPEAAMVMVLYEIGEAIESLCLSRARNAIRSLLDVSPKTATVLMDGQWRSMPAHLVPIGTTYRIEPGERAALDGDVIEGFGAMDESMLTGESIPVDKRPGERVWAGALTIDTALTVRSSAMACDSMSARIIRAVEEAEQKKAPVQRFIDVFAARYTPTVFALSLATALLGGTVFSLSWSEAVYRALVLLVIACPCALVISTPVTIVSALALAAKHGVLVKGGVYLEQGRRLVGIALDKTGTVTRGRPDYRDQIVLSPVDGDRIRQLALSLSRQSSHPVSLALTRRFETDGIEPLAVTAFKALPGYGTEARVAGSLVRLTNLTWLEQNRLATPAVRAAFEKAHEQGHTAVALSDFFGVMAVFSVADTLKPNANEAIESMKSAGLTPYLLTGDNDRAAQAIAEAVGIEHVHSQLLPQDKLNRLEALQQTGPCAMAGDGINDAPALTRAPIGFAMGTKGSDAAIEAADVALMDDDIGKIAWFKRLSILTHRTLIANIVFALSVKFGFALAAVAGLANMWMAVFADTGVCLIVVAYGMRLMRAERLVERVRIR